MIQVALDESSALLRQSIKMSNIPKEIKERLQKLQEAVRYHSRLYHTLDKPEISDTAYDTLVKELEDLEEKYPELFSKNSPTRI